MRIGFIINDFKTEEANYTTVGLGHAAHGLGHDTWFMGASDFTYDPSGNVCAHARTVSGEFATQQDYHAALTSDATPPHRLALGELDVLLLRHDPSEETERKAWAQFSPILFAQLAARDGTVVLNDPGTLASAMNKTYFQQFPESVRPRTLISRSKDEIRRFIDSENGNAVLKPLQGSGGRNVFLVKDGDSSNLNQIIEAISVDGYVVAQEYLADAMQGDVRLFVMNGQPLCVGERFAALRRVSGNGDMRSNIHAGGHPEAVEMTPQMSRLVETVRPKLVRDGMFLVGLDIVGNKLMEVNVFSPGGLHTMNELYGVDFFVPVINSLERKAEARQNYRNSIDNIELATL